MEAMEVIDVYNHPDATIVELEDRYEFFGGHNCGAFIPGSRLPHRQWHTKSSSKPTSTVSSSA